MVLACMEIEIAGDDEDLPGADLVQAAEVLQLRRPLAPLGCMTARLQVNVDNSPRTSPRRDEVPSITVFRKT